MFSATFYLADASFYIRGQENVRTSRGSIPSVTAPNQIGFRSGDHGKSRVERRNGGTHVRPGVGSLEFSPVTGGTKYFFDRVTTGSIVSTSSYV